MEESKVAVVRLDFEGQVCIYDNIEGALEEIGLFWSEDGPEQGVELGVTFHMMTKADHEALPEFAGW